jgi:hypothetical protein
MIDVVARAFPSGISLPDGASRHLPMEELKLIEEALNRQETLLFRGPSGGAYSAAAAAAIYHSKVTLIGSAGSDGEYFRKGAAMGKFRFFDPVAAERESGHKALPAGRFISFTEGKTGPFANPSAALSFRQNHVPPISKRDIPFFEGFLLSRLPASLTVGSSLCAVDLSAPFIAERLHDHIVSLEKKSRLILFGNIEESEHFFDVDFGSGRQPGSALRKAIDTFCKRGHRYLLKMGAQGAWMFQREEEKLEERYIPPLSAKEIHPVNTGDAFAGAFLGSIAAEHSLQEALEAAAYAGAAVASVIGNIAGDGSDQTDKASYSEGETTTV